MFWFILFVILMFTYPPAAIVILIFGIASKVFIKKKN